MRVVAREVITMNEKDIQRLKTLAKVAQDGEWNAVGARSKGYCITGDSFRNRTNIVTSCDEYGHFGPIHSKANAEYIAAANPDTILKLIAQAELAKGIPEQAAISCTGTVYYGIEEMYHKFEEGEALHLTLDDMEIPRYDESLGREYSLWGRVNLLADSIRQETEKEMEIVYQVLHRDGQIWTDVDKFVYDTFEPRDRVRKLYKPVD